MPSEDIVATPRPLCVEFVPLVDGSIRVDIWNSRDKILHGYTSCYPSREIPDLQSFINNCLLIIGRKLF